MTNIEVLKINSLIQKYEEDPQTFKYWVLPKKNGFFRIVDKTDLDKVVKRTKTDKSARTWVITKELEENT